MFKIILFSAIVVTNAAKLPSNFGRCHLSDPKLTECLKVNIEAAIRTLAPGSPQIGLHPLEPLDIPSLTIGQGTGPVQVEQNFKNVHLHGLTGSKVISVGINYEKNQLYAKSVTPMLRLEGEYSMAGRVLLLPIVGNGPCNVTLINTKINHTLQMERFEKKGNSFWKLKDYQVTLRPEKVTFKFDNLFNGQERLGEEINKVLNDNWDEVFTDVRGGYEKSFGLIFDDLANRVFSRVALKDIFLQD